MDNNDVLLPNPSFRTLMERMRLKNASGPIAHYTNFDALEAIARCKKLRLTRYDLMKGVPEGKEICNNLCRAIDAIVLEKTISADDGCALKHELKSMVGFTVPHNLFYDDRFCEYECIPYLICFTKIGLCEAGDDHLESSVLKENRRFILDRDLRMELDCSAIRALITKEWHEALEFGKMDYSSSVLYEELLEDVREIIERNLRPDGSLDINRAAKRINSVVGAARMLRLPPEYSSQNEVRLIAYIPCDLEDHPELSKLFRFAGDDREYIYIDFDRTPKRFCVTINPKYIDPEIRIERILRDAGYEPAVRLKYPDPGWAKALSDLKND